MPTFDNATYLDRYAQSLMGVYGRPKAVLARGQGCYVWDVEGNRYLDLLAGIAVNALGHGHPAVVGALSRQAASLIHVSNFCLLYTSDAADELTRVDLGARRI